MNQGELFHTGNDLPPPDEIVNCSKCGASIVVQGHGRPGYTTSEYRSATGECWKCSKAAK